jgi:aromatic-L-amino-acid/L-tryptophan decarboxylase
MLAEMLAAGLNANLGGRDQIPIQVEQQVTKWMQQLFGFPDTASGLFVTGSSIANLIGLLVARTAKIGTAVRQTGLQHDASKLIAYTSCDGHSCLDRAMEIAGLGSHQLRKIAVNAIHQIDLQLLAESIEADKAEGNTPFCIFGTAGTVNVGAIDDLTGLAEISKREGLWLHIDGACGALGMFSASIRKKLLGIEQADSIALDFHKWGQVPYDSGFILVRDSQMHQDTFTSPAEYLRRETRGMAAGSPWPCDFGPDLSRSFKALKVWFTLQVYGTNKLAGMMDRTCELAQYLASRIDAIDELELLAPVNLNIVCFRYRDIGTNPTIIDRLNADIVIAIQESGIVAPSSTKIRGQLAIRAAIFNHRTTRVDIDHLIEETIRAGKRLTQRKNESPCNQP